MAWTTPRTWVYNEVVTAALFNAHIRDNQGILKTPFDDNGLVQAISSTYFASLSGANLTGVPQTASDNDPTGNNDFSSGTLVVPVGTDQYIDDGGTKRAGCIWVEGDYLHYIDATNSEWRWLGTYVSTPGGGAVAGSVWIDSSTNVASIRYIDADGDERYIPRNSSAVSSSGATAGSVWVEGDYLYVVRADTGAYHYAQHWDIAHSDGTAHTDDHSNVAFVDSHGDVTFVDSHMDWHGDGGYSDTYHTDHSDAHGDSYSDTPHTNTYSDTAHQNFTDSHSDYSDTPHEDLPEEIGV